MRPEATEPALRRGLGLGQKLFLGAAVALLAGSMGLRALHGSAGGASAGGGLAGSALVAGDAGGGGAAAPAGLERYLPYFTEASFFALIGFALGYATRKLFRVLLIVLALGFVALQVLVSTGYVEIDWLGVRSVVNRWILNLKQHETITSFLTDRVPSAGALIAGWFFGVRRG